MIILSSRKLEQALASNGLSPWDKVKYIILPVVVMGLFPAFYIFRPIYGKYPPILNSLIGIIFMIISAFLTYKGIKKCFKTNQNADAKNFFERFTILSVPVCMKFILVLFPLTVALVFIMIPLKDSFPEFYKRFPIIFTASSPFLTWIYYHLLTCSIKRHGELVHTDKRKNS